MINVCLFHEVKNVPISKNEVCHKISQLCNRENPSLKGTINIIIVDDSRIQELNRMYLHHDYTTDVISFPLEKNNNYLEGEVYASWNQIAAQAATYQVDVQEELWRVFIHGVLHLLGYDDHTSGQRNQMKNKEDYYLDYLGIKRKEL